MYNKYSSSFLFCCERNLTEAPVAQEKSYLLVAEHPPVEGFPVSDIITVSSFPKASYKLTYTRP